MVLLTYLTLMYINIALEGDSFISETVPQRLAGCSCASVPKLLAGIQWLDKNEKCSLFRRLYNRISLYVLSDHCFLLLGQNALLIIHRINKYGGLRWGNSEVPASAACISCLGAKLWAGKVPLKRFLIGWFWLTKGWFSERLLVEWSTSERNVPTVLEQRKYSLFFWSYSNMNCDPVRVRQGPLRLHFQIHIRDRTLPYSAPRSSPAAKYRNTSGWLERKD